MFKKKQIVIFAAATRKKPADNISISDNNHPAFQFYRVFLLGVF